MSAAQLLSEIAAARPRTEAERELLLKLKLEALSLLAIENDEIQRARALVVVTSTLQDAELAYGRVDIQMLPFLRTAAQVQLRYNRAEEAVRLLNRALGISKSAYGEDDPVHRFILYELATAHARVGSPARARIAKEKADYMNRIAEAAIQGGITLGPAQPLGAEASHQIVPVFFQTTRTPTNRSDPSERFSKVRDNKSHYGVSYVSVPKKRDIGSVPRPSYFRLEFRADPSRHVIVLKEMSIYRTEGEFWKAMQERLRTSVQKEALLYIHGFNQSFGDGVKTAATLSADLEIDGAVLSFIWPSQNNLLLYTRDLDEALAFDNRVALKGLLGDLAGRTGAKTVHVVAHSMGNRLLIEAMNLMAADVSRSAISNIVFASPDAQSSDFTSATNRLSHLWKQMTLYTAAGDLALDFSAVLRGELASRTTRAGDRDGGVLATSFLDVVDTSTIKNDILGHSNFLLMAKDDLRALFWFGIPAGKRCVLVEKRPYGWRYEPSATCTTEAFSQASLYLRRFPDAEQALTRLEANGDPQSRTAARILLGLRR